MNLGARDDFMECLTDYIDARIQYAAADPEWRSHRECSTAQDRLEAALTRLLTDKEL